MSWLKKTTKAIHPHAHREPRHPASLHLPLQNVGVHGQHHEHTPVLPLHDGTDDQQHEHIPDPCDLHPHATLLLPLQDADTHVRCHEPAPLPPQHDMIEDQQPGPVPHATQLDGPEIQPDAPGGIPDQRDDHTTQEAGQLRACQPPDVPDPNEQPTQEYIDIWVTDGNTVIQTSYTISSQESGEGDHITHIVDPDGVARSATSATAPHPTQYISGIQHSMTGPFPTGDVPTRDAQSEPDSEVTLALGGADYPVMEVMAPPDVVVINSQDSAPETVAESNDEDISMTDAVAEYFEEGEEKSAEMDDSESLGSEDTQYFEDPSGVIFGRRRDHVSISSDPRKRKGWS